MKVAVVIFHKNYKRYPLKWIEVCLDSIRNQTFQDFDVFELDYGGNGNQLYEGSSFINVKMPDHAQALNYLLEYVFERGYDCAFNTNIDDFYSADRFEKQLPYIRLGYDIVSSNFHIVNGKGEVFHSMKMDDKDFEYEAFSNDNNCIAHPVICYSSRFDGKLISEEIPKDDFALWKRCYSEKKYKFIILPDYLLYYRVHDKKTS